MSGPHIIIIRETLQESVVKDLVSFACLFAVVAVGIWVGSQALQWVGAVLWIIWMLSKALAANRVHYTIEEARRRLDDLASLTPPQTK